MKILIADDEEYTREGIVSSISWEKYGIQEVMQATNGAEAEKIAKWFQPDIILTDIRMPKMDGIEFAQRMLQSFEKCRIIFISGYMEIDYYKSAIKMSAIDYIEKPIDIRVLEHAVQKAAEQIERERTNIRNTKVSTEYRQQMLYHLLISKEPEESALLKMAQELKFSLKQQYTCIVLSFPNIIRRKVSEEYISVWKNQIADSMFSFVYDADWEARQIRFLLGYSEKQQYRLSTLFHKLVDVDEKIRLGFGVEVDSYKAIYNSYKTANAAINCAFYIQEQRIFQIDQDIIEKSAVDPGIYSEFTAILTKDSASLKDWFEQLFDQLFQNKYYHREQVYALLTSLTNALYKKFPFLFDRAESIRSEEQIHGMIRSMDTLHEIKDFMYKVLEEIEKDNEEKEGYSRIVRGVMLYVEQHYMEEDLSVTQIAEYMHFAPAYLNVIFKQETKCTIKQYLSNYRLEKAKYKLEQDYEKITEIAVNCGYANANYFSKVFREAEGMSPIEYRNAKGKF